MNVLMVIDALHLGGAERVLATLSRVAPAAGFRFSVQVLSPPGARQSMMEPVLTEADVAVEYLHIPRLADPRAVPRIMRRIRETRCDVVHAHLEYAATLVPVAARLERRPALCTFHHVAVPVARREALKERLAVLAANRSAGVVFVSDASLRSFARVYGGPRKNWKVIANGVDLEHFAPGPAELPPELGLPDGVPLVTIVGALRWRKGHSFALEAWPSVRRRVPAARLLIVGDGPEAGALRERARALSVEASVVFAGMRTDVARILRASSLVVLPSQHEALPTTLIEAAACGRAVVATDVDGIPEVVADGDTGLLVPFADVDALGGAIVALLEDGARRREMELRARRLAEERFDAGQWARHLAAAYSHVCEAGRRLTG
jgi:glycosyltransferase involved in cell wall biosynthesis